MRAQRTSDVGDLEPLRRVFASQMEVSILCYRRGAIVKNNLMHPALFPPGPEVEQYGAGLQLATAGDRGGWNGEMEPGVLASRAFDSGEGPYVPDGGEAVRIFYLHTNPVNPRSKHYTRHLDHSCW